ncbi:MAG TPA: hypothetical protein VHI73_00460 [Solirubrobacteraceae bacterium]|jgi:hypothetical protein|nr:hypothetical protein [Solirubrobacteraceae bacterium]
MTTAAARPQELLSPEEIDERTLHAWTAYRDSLRELTGREYDEAEHRSWERLQRKLRQLEQCRVELASAGEQR